MGYLLQKTYGYEGDSIKICEGRVSGTYRLHYAGARWDIYNNSTIIKGRKCRLLSILFENGFDNEDYTRIFSFHTEEKILNSKNGAKEKTMYFSHNCIINILNKYFVPFLDQKSDLIYLYKNTSLDILIHSRDIIDYPNEYDDPYDENGLLLPHLDLSNLRITT